MGASTGFRVKGQPSPGPFHAYRCSNGILLQGGSNVNAVTAECGIGIFGFQNKQEYPQLFSSQGSNDAHYDALGSVADKEVYGEKRRGCEEGEDERGLFMNLNMNLF